MKKSGLITCLFALFTILLARDAGAIPNSISISGFLANAADQPVSGTFDYQLAFYASQTTTTHLAVINGSAEIEAGIFDLAVVPPEDLLTLQEAWYTLAIDTDNGGIDANDLFGDRFRIASVPYALSGRPVEFYAPYGITMSFRAGFNSGNEPHLSVMPFVTPAGGVEFTKLGAYIMYGDYVGGAPPTARYSVGIYDKNGLLVAQTGVRDIALNEGGLLTWDVAGSLRPSELYYIGYAVNNYQIATWGIIEPPAPGKGLILNVINNGALPGSFNPADIVTSPPSRALAVSFLK